MVYSVKCESTTYHSRQQLGSNFQTSDSGPYSDRAFKLTSPSIGILDPPSFTVTDLQVRTVTVARLLPDISGTVYLLT